MKKLLFTITNHQNPLFNTAFNLVDKKYTTQNADVWITKTDAAEAMKTFLSCVGGSYCRDIQEASHVCVLYSENGQTKAYCLELGFNIGSSYEVDIDNLDVFKKGKELFFLVTPSKK